MKKFILVSLIVFCLVSVNIFASTRQEIQVALDFIRFVNVTNDLIYVGISAAKNEMKLPIFDVSNNYIGDRDMTIVEIKDKLKRTKLNIEGYKDLIDNFLATPENLTSATKGLTALGVDIQDMKDDILLIYNSIADINLLSITTLGQLNQIGIDLETAIPRLPLIRKATCIGCN